MPHPLRHAWLRIVCSTVVAAGSSQAALVAQHAPERLAAPANCAPANCAPALQPQRIIVNVPQPEVVVNQSNASACNQPQQQPNCGLFGRHSNNGPRVVHHHHQSQAPAYAPQQQMMPYMMPQMGGGGMTMTMMPMMTMTMMPVMMPSMGMNMNMGMGMNFGAGMGMGTGMMAAPQVPQAPQINANVSLAGLLGNLGATGAATGLGGGAGGANGMVNATMESLAELTMLKMAAKSMDDQATAALVQRLQQSMLLTETLNRAALAALLANRAPAVGSGANAANNQALEQLIESLRNPKK